MNHADSCAPNEGRFCCPGDWLGQRGLLMLEALLSFLIFVVVVLVIAGLVLWAVDRFFPEAGRPARLVVGAVALIAILYALLPLVRSVHLP